MDYYIYKVQWEGKSVECLSIAPNELVFKKDVGNQAIVGYLKNEKLDYKDFTENKAFKELFHKVVADELPNEAGLLNEGKKTSTGYVYIIDQRTKKPKGDVPVQDIIGVVNFENGNIVADSYIPNNNYKLLTKDGLFQLPYSLEEKLLQIVKKST